MQQKYSCPKCGAQIAFGVKFCTSCGIPLNWPTQQKMQPPPDYQQEQYGYGQERPKQKSTNPWLIGFITVIVIGAFVAGGMFALDTFSESTQSVPPALAPPPSQTPESTPLEATGISGVYAPCPEAEGKIELAHQVMKRSPEWYIGHEIRPWVKLTIKNISHAPLQIGPGNLERFNCFTLRVISKDKLGQTLGEQWVGATLQPKEVRVKEVALFSSDETVGYEIRLLYFPIPQVSGVYIETPDAEGKVNIAHRIIGYSGVSEIHIKIEFKNISDKGIDWDIPIGASWEDYYGPFKIVVTYKDASGMVIEPKEEIRVCYGHHGLSPGETGNYYASIGIDLAKKIKTYEIKIVQVSGS